MSEKSGNTFNKGLFLDVGKASQPEGTYSFALNAVNQDEEGFIGFLSNERGFTEKLDLANDLTPAPNATILIGAVPLDRDDFVVFLVDEIGSESEVWYVDSNYNALQILANATWVPTASLNFSSKHQIQGTYRIDASNHRIVYWTDNLNPPRCIDVDALISYLPTPYYSGPSTYYTDPLQLNIFPQLTYPLMEYAYTKDTGGSAVETGMYQFAVRYLDDNLNPTNWSTPTMPVPVILSDYFGPAEWDVDSTGSGGIAPVLTTKTLTYTLSNLDLNYKYYEVAVIHTKLGTSNAYIVDREPITGTNDEYTFKGINSTHPSIDVEEITTPFVSYEAAKTIVQKGNRLLLGNLVGRETYNYQPYANNIQVNYVTFKVRAGNTTPAMLQSYKYGTGYFYWKSFMRDEVYSIGICFLYRDGTYSPVYHIPGRPADLKVVGDGSTTAFTLGDDGYSTNLQDIHTNTNLRNTYLAGNVLSWDTNPVALVGSGDGENSPVANITDTPELWQVANTAARQAVYETITPSDPGVGYFVHSFGQLAYWQSTDSYPGDANIWGSLAGARIRHHKMPDTCVEPIFIDDSNPDAPAVADEEFIYPMALMFSNIEIPPDLQEQIQGIKIVVTPRDIEANKSIVAKGVFFHTQAVTEGHTGSTAGSLTGGSGVLDEFAAPAGDYLVQNYPFNGLNNNTSIFYDQMSNNSTDLEERVLVFNSADTLFFKPYIQDVSFIRVEGIYQSNQTTTLTYGLKATRTDRQYLSIIDNTGATFSSGLNVASTAFKGNFYANVGFTYGFYNTTVTTYSVNLYNRNIENISYIGGGQKLSSGIFPLPGGLKGFSNSTQQECIVFTIQDNDPAYAQNISANGVNPGITGLDNSGIPATYNSFQAAIFYGSLKKYNANQYQTIHDLTYRDTGCLLLNPTYDPISNMVLEASFDINTLTTIRQNSTYELVPQLICFGDTFINKAAFKRTFDYNIMNPGTSFGAGNIPQEGHTYWYWGEHYLMNSDLRGIIDSDVNSSYWPHLQSAWDAQEYITAGAYVYNNTFAFLEDYNIDNRLYSFVIFPETYDPTIETGRYITRVIWSERSVKEEISDAYRIFLVNNYYDIQKNRGELWNLAVKDDVLFAHCQDGLYRTFTNEQAIQTDASNTYIGTGEFFSVDPRELVTLENGGFAGTISQWASIPTPYGYIFPDARRTSVFRLSEGLKDIGDEGLSNWFNKNMPLFLKEQLDSLAYQLNSDWKYPDYDNPASPTGIGYLAAYDNKFGRYILTKKDYVLTSAGQVAFLNANVTDAGVGGNYPKIWYDESLGTFILKQTAISVQAKLSLGDTTYFENKSWTISYSFLSNSWISWHSYLPTFMFNVRNRVFSQDYLKNDSIFLHDTEGNNFGKYHTMSGGVQTIYPFIVEVTNAQYPGEMKVFDSLEFHMETFRLDGYGNWINAGSGNYAASPSSTQEEPFFNSIWMYNSYQSSGDVTLTYNVNAKRRERIWRVSDFRDLSVDPYTTHERKDWAYTNYKNVFVNGGYIDKVPNASNVNANKDWYKKERFRDKYNTFRVTYNNTRGNDQAGNALPGDKFVLKFVNTLFRISPR